MTLWNIIRDFFVQYIFGGTLASGDTISDNFLGSFLSIDSNGILQDVVGNNTAQGYIPVNMFDGANEEMLNYINFGDWLSTTATIITLCAICVFLFFFVRWLFRLTAGLVSGRG